MKCQNCKKDNPDPKPVLRRLPGRPANNGRSHAYGGKPEVWCGLCRGSNPGRWKYAPAAKKREAAT